jgi:uncharacterized protein YdeI (YjbR/CyaY-like superfamily)
MRCKYGATPQCKVHQWNEILEALRQIILECGLEEEFKWSHPCYTANKKNIAVLGAFKEYASLNFFKGALLTDPNSLLIQPTENSQSGRQFRFNNLDQVWEQQHAIKAFLQEAMELEVAGKKVSVKKHEDYEIPAELQEVMQNDLPFAAAFQALTPGRQRSYFLYFSQAKQSATRFSRIEKSRDRIFAGKGWNEM